MITSAATLDDFMALNDELAALIAADVPLDLGLNDGDEAPASRLERINAAVARQVSRGATLPQALAAADSLPPTYRCLVQVGLRSGQLDAALDGAQRLAQNAEESRYGIRAALAYPLIVCTLAYAGLILLCRLYVPRMEDMQYVMRVGEGVGLPVLQKVRDAMPYWIAIPPVVLLLFLLWPRQWRVRARSVSPRSAGLWARLTGRARAVSQERLANFAEALAALLEADAPLDEALPLAACSAGDAALSHSAGELTAALRQNPELSDDSPAARGLPPFLRWALLKAEPTIDRTRALHMAASVYRDSSERHAERVRILAPILACVLIGGTATLLYGLAVFVPVVDMLNSLGAPLLET